MREAVIFDMDGTLCDVRPVRHYVTGDDRNFDKFHKASLFCHINFDVECAVWDAQAKGQSVLIVTARDARYERVTRDWLRKYDVRFDRLYMRGWGDTRRDSVVKEEILAAIRSDGFDPVLAVDDNPAVIEVWERNGIPTVIVPGFDDPVPC